MKPPIESTLKLLSPALSKFNALAREQARLEKAEMELREQVDVAERSGNIDDEKLISQLATDRARLSMFPAKLAQIEADLAAALEGVKAPMFEAGRILGQHAADVRAAVTDQLHQVLAPLVEQAHLRQEMIDLSLESVAAVCEARALAGTFASLAINEAMSNQALPELAERLVNQFSPEQAA